MRPAGTGETPRKAAMVLLSARRRDQSLAEPNEECGVQRFLVAHKASRLRLAAALIIERVIRLALF